MSDLTNHSPKITYQNVLYINTDTRCTYTTYIDECV